MSKLVFRILTEDAEIDAFLEGFKSYVKVKLPASYAGNGVVVGAFCENELIGGYMMVSQGPFRSLALVPDDIKDTTPVLKNATPTDFVEVNGFWVKERFRGSALSMNIWLQIRKDVLASKASHLLLFYNAQAKGLAQFYEEFLRPEGIYKGAPASHASVSTAHAEISVGVVSRLNIRLCVYRGLGRVISRKFLGWTRSSQRGEPKKFMQVRQESQ